jgi:hypothetical protein
MSDLLHPDEAEQDDAAETPIETGDFVLALAAENQMEADLLVSACEEAGIPAIQQSPRSGPVGTIASPVDGFAILVPRKDADRAVRILTERKQALEADPEGAARAAEEEEAQGEKA